MSDDHGDRDLKGKAPQQKLGTVLRSFFDHVTSHDEEGVHAALCMVANDDSEDSTSTHICSFGAGNPDVLAQMMIMAIDMMIKENPGFAEAWQKALLAKRLQSMVAQVMDVVQQAKEQVDEAKGMDTAKPVADALLEKLKGNPGAVPGPETKQ